MSFNNRNQKWSFRWTGRSPGGLDLSLDLPIGALTIETRKFPSQVKGLSYVEVLQGVNHLSMSILLCLVLWSNWSLGAHILQDIAEIGWDSQNWRNIFLFISAGTPQMGTETFRSVIIVFSTPWKLTSRDFWNSGNERKPLSKQTCVLRKCCGVSQKWWMLELSNLCHCVQHPWKLTSRSSLDLSFCWIIQFLKIL